MKFVKLKDKFISEACKLDKEFMTNTNRGYALVIECSGTKYLIPLRSNLKHNYSFKNPVTNKFLDYTKSFELTNYNIIERNYSLERSEFVFYFNNKSEIMKELTNFNKIRGRIPQSVDILKMNVLQNGF